MPPARYPAPQLVQQGETIALDVMVSPGGRQKIVDYLQLSPPEPIDLPPAPVTTGPRDFTVDDEPLHIDADSFERTTVLVDGQRFTGRVGFRTRTAGCCGLPFPGKCATCYRWLRTPASRKKVRSGIMRSHFMREAGNSKSGWREPLRVVGMPGTCMSATILASSPGRRLPTPSLWAPGAWKTFYRHTEAMKHERNPHSGS